MTYNIHITKNIYKTLTYVIYSLYLLMYLGLWRSAPIYLDDLNYYLKIFIGAVLVFTFNPFVHIRSGYVHRNISFSAGLLLLASTTLSSFQKRVANTANRVKKMF